MKTIELDYDGVKYKLAFTRDSVVKAEDMGLINYDFVNDEIKRAKSKKKSDEVDIKRTVHSAVFAANIFRAAFLAYNPKVTNEKIDEIYKVIPDKEGIAGLLSDMFLEPIGALLEEPSGDEPKKATWTVNE